jgi:hypothetical protein
MYVKEHIILGILFSIILFLIFPQIGLVGFSLIFLSTVLIDVDHYLYYVKKKKDFSLRNAYKWFMKNHANCLKLPKEQRGKNYAGFFVLHGIEILIVLLLLTFVSNYFFFVFIGFSFHLLFDILDQTSYKKTIDRLSVIYDYTHYKKNAKNKNA